MFKRIQKILSDGKRDIVKACTKPLPWDANYACENDDYMNALHPHRFTGFVPFFRNKFPGLFKDSD